MMEKNSIPKLVFYTPFFVLVSSFRVWYHRPQWRVYAGGGQPRIGRWCRHWGCVSQRLVNWLGITLQSAWSSYLLVNFLVRVSALMLTSSHEAIALSWLFLYITFSNFLTLLQKFLHKIIFFCTYALGHNTQLLYSGWYWDIYLRYSLFL
jgi:hypothetical protein